MVSQESRHICGAAVALDQKVMYVYCFLSPTYTQRSHAILSIVEFKETHDAD